MAYEAKTQTVQEITDQLEEGIKQMFESSRYKNWLDTMSRFHRYSLNNTLLIAFQRPDASLVAGYSAWQKNFGRQVVKGEKAIKIIAPAPYKEKVEVDKIDPKTNKPILNENGQPQKVEKEITRASYKVVNVFDVSQTEGRELPSLGVDELTGDVAQYELFIEALKNSCPVPIHFENIPGLAKGYYDLASDKIVVKSGMSQQQTLKTLIHEMTHQRLHGSEKEVKDLSRSGKEVEAESVAYTICKHYGIDTSEYSFSYIAGWSSEKEMPELKASLSTIRKTAVSMIKEIDEKFAELEKEAEWSIEKEAGALALEFDQFAYDADFYDYTDVVTSREEELERTKGILLAGPSKELDGIRSYLEDFIDDEYPYSKKAEELIGKLEAFCDRLSRRNEIDRQQEAPEGSQSLPKEAGPDNGRPKYSEAQMGLLQELKEKGYDPKITWVGGKPLDLTNPMSVKEVEEVRYQMNADANSPSPHTKDKDRANLIYSMEKDKDKQMNEKGKFQKESKGTNIQSQEKTPKKSLLHDLRKKLAIVSGTKTSKTDHKKIKEELS